MIRRRCHRTGHSWRSCPRAARARSNIWIMNLRTRAVRGVTTRRAIQGDTTKPHALPASVVVPGRSVDRLLLGSATPSGADMAMGRGGSMCRSRRSTSCTLTAQGCDRSLRRAWRPARRSGRRMGRDWSSMNSLSKRRGSHDCARALAQGRRHRSSPSRSRPNARQVETTGPGLKVAPQFLDATNIAYLMKSGPTVGGHADAWHRRIPASAPVARVVA